MNNNRIEGRHGTTSWHNTAKSSGLPVEVLNNLVLKAASLLPTSFLLGVSMYLKEQPGDVALLVPN